MHSKLGIALQLFFLLAFSTTDAHFFLDVLPVNDLYVECKIGTPVDITLHAVAPIPDGVLGGTLAWQMRIHDSSRSMVGHLEKHNYTSGDKVVGIKVLVRGLYHETALDVRMKLLHEGKSVILTGGSSVRNSRDSTRAFGLPYPRATADLSNLEHARVKHDKQFVQTVVPGVGFDYLFKDVEGQNLADSTMFALSYSASSSMNGDNTAAWRMGDGDKVSSGAATHTEEYPWVQVDLGRAVSIGTVMIWTPDPENQVREVQAVQTKGLVTLGGSFVLRVFNNGISQDTEPINHDAVATTLFEDPSSTSKGNAVGESMQSKLQALPNVGLVSVSRSNVDRSGGYQWFVTFLTEYTNLDEMIVVSNDLTAGPKRAQSDQIATVTVSTVTNGTRNTFYNQNQQYATLLLSNTSFGDSNFSAAQNLSSVEKIFEFFPEQRQQNIPMPANTVARYIRVVLRQVSYLSVSEILVYEDQMVSVNEFEGGSPVPPGIYTAESSIADTFADTLVIGEWFLEVQDLTSQYVINEASSLLRAQQHGVGALSDWQLEIAAKNSQGELYNFTSTHYVDISAVVQTLPVHGTLYMSEAYQEGVLISPKVGDVINLSKCYTDCSYKFGVGNRLSTSLLGSVAEKNKLVASRHVTYVPLHNSYVGPDTFTYRLNTGVRRVEDIGTVHIDVKRCRNDDCGNDVFTEYISYRHELRTNG